MKQIIKAGAIVAAFGIAVPMATLAADETGHKAHQMTEKAAEKKVTFTIEKMTCAMCPITVRKAMEKIDGVKSVTTDYEARTATVVFDSKKADVAAIANASTQAGYPAILQETKGS